MMWTQCITQNVFGNPEQLFCHSTEDIKVSWSMVSGMPTDLTTSELRCTYLFSVSIVTSAHSAMLLLVLDGLAILLDLTSYYQVPKLKLIVH